MNSCELFQNQIQWREKLSYQSYDTYKELKTIARQENPDITKEEIYEQLLKPFRYEKVKYWNRILRRFKISYICRYEGWDKKFTKTWNLLDHVRMHEGIKPYTVILFLLKNYGQPCLNQGDNTKVYFLVE